MATNARLSARVETYWMHATLKDFRRQARECAKTLRQNGYTLKARPRIAAPKDGCTIGDPCTAAHCHVEGQDIGKICISKKVMVAPKSFLIEHEKDIVPHEVAHLVVPGHGEDFDDVLRVASGV